MKHISQCIEERVLINGVTFSTKEVKRAIFVHGIEETCAESSLLHFLLGTGWASHLVRSLSFYRTFFPNISLLTQIILCGMVLSK